MPWAQVEEWMDYWLDYPPLHILVRGAVGYERPEADAKMGPAEIAAKFGGQVVKRGA